MNSLPKLIGQYDGDKIMLSLILKEIIKSESPKLMILSDWIKSLASRPTCGEEQRKFLDEVEKGALSCYDELSNPKKYILRFGNGYRLYDGDFQGIDLSKVINGERAIIRLKENNMNIEQIAKTAHEVNRAYCLSIGDISQPSWEDAPDWQKKSAVNGVKFHLENPDAKPEDSHNSWLKEKEADGWKYGEVKDPEKKEHPCFVIYDQLPQEQKTKDYLFIGVVRSF